jgi:UDP-N-acetylglucosamine acyltransferase
MSSAASARIHPTAVVSAEAVLADNVEVGPYVVIEGRVTVGPDCVLRPHAMLCGPLTMGRGNLVYSGAVLGDRPQHLKYNDEPTSVEIGDYNVFREHVTVHRGTTQSHVTRIGSHNFFMVNAHVAHDCKVGNRCILANGALLGGHCVVEDNVYLSGNSAVHQFVRVGRLALLSGVSATTKDIPPFVIQQNIDTVVGVNVVGMRRAGLSHAQIDAVREAFKVLFRANLVLPAALAQLEQELGHVDVVAEMVAFLRQSHRGISPMRGRHHRDAA